VAALERLRNSIVGDIRIVIRLIGRRKPRRPTKKAMMKHKRLIQAAEREFIGLLSRKDRIRYQTEAKPWLMNQKTKQAKQIDLAGARRWVAKRAYDFGWKKELFQHDSGALFEYKTDRAVVERIGKKYQWLALSELLCRLSDNYWIAGTHGDGTRKYDNPTDISFSRDIDPTVLPKEDEASKESRMRDLQINSPVITISQTPEDELTKWPFAVDLSANFDRLIRRVDDSGAGWFVLYDHRSATNRYETRIGMHGLRQQEFRFVLTAVTTRPNRDRFISYIQRSRNIDVMHWHPPELTDGPYLREASWRTTWPQMKWCSERWQPSTISP
jgi:hypothetical protein